MTDQGDGGPLSCSWASGSSSYWSGKSEELATESPVANSASYFKVPRYISKECLKQGFIKLSFPHSTTSNSFKERFMITTISGV